MDSEALAKDVHVAATLDYPIVFRDNDGVEHTITDWRMLVSNRGMRLVLLSREEVVRVTQDEIEFIHIWKDVFNILHTFVRFAKPVNGYRCYCSCEEYW